MHTISYTLVRERVNNMKILNPLTIFVYTGDENNNNKINNQLTKYYYNNECSPEMH